MESVLNTLNKKELDKALELIKNELDYYRENYIKYKKLVARTEQELYADLRKEIKNDYEEENAELREAAELTYGQFSYKEEMEAYEQFCKDHIKCRLKKCNNGRLPYVKETGTGLGVIYEVYCPVCGEHKDITYTEGW
jgi:hypothetical protein